MHMLISSLSASPPKMLLPISTDDNGCIPANVACFPFRVAGEYAGVSSDSGSGLIIATDAPASLVVSGELSCSG